MKILSHRGYWLNGSEKNTRAAFERSFSLGFGTETDLRDFDGQVVISHDPANSACMRFDEFLEIYRRFPGRPFLALNVKADGLQAQVQRTLSDFGVGNYFVFDMAVPDALQYLRRGMATFTRHSEYEPVPAYYEASSGVWIDEFDRHWVTDDAIAGHLAAKKQVCIVSPELHGRAHDEAWDHYRRFETRFGKDDLMLCTDFPERAMEFFNA